MYIEHKVDGVNGRAWIGRVTFSESGSSLDYQGRRFESLKGRGFKANYVEVETGEEYWISGCRQDGDDRLYSGSVAIDEDVREEYWTEIRGQWDRRDEATIQASGEDED